MRYLVQHDYGMGALWWWITAPSAEAIVEAFAEVEVVDDPVWVDQDWDPPLTEVDIGGPFPPGLDGLHAQRTAQRSQPGYGAFAGAERVHLRRDDPDDDGTTWFTELGADGRRLREVERFPDGTAVARDEWMMNPPEDLRDPNLAPFACTADEFEAAWRSATPS